MLETDDGRSVGIEESAHSVNPEQLLAFKSAVIDFLKTFSARTVSFLIVGSFYNSGQRL